MVMKEITLYKIHVTGHVQGVGFRWRTVIEARNLGISGFVKNLPDGSVYIEAEGTRTRLAAFIDFCRNGPGHVDSVITEECPPINYSGFRVEY